MEYQQILYEVAEAIATITLNRPERLNAWTMRMASEVHHAFRQAEKDDAVRVIIVTGAGKGYCAGADMNLLQGLQQGSTEGEQETNPISAEDEDPATPAAFRGPYSYPLGLHKPVIAAVNGAATGLGLSYMLFYDLRIASDRARFGTVFARRGLVAEHGIAWLLPRLIGMANACDLLFSGRLINAEEALRMGLINRVVPHDSLLPTVRQIATEMATQCSPRSLRIMKRQLYGATFTDLTAAMNEADSEMIMSFGTDDFREGVASFLERRQPRFTGR
ncbi:MAG TPA: enoyl-CoA hydratase [Candidatus Binatia bacterium]